MKIQVKLKIHGHCIETEAKNEFKKMMDEFFESEEISKVDEGKISLLRDFIETSDFALLRSSDKRLSGEIDSELTIFRDENNKICIGYL